MACSYTKWDVLIPNILFDTQNVEENNFRNSKDQISSVISSDISIAKIANFEKKKGKLFQILPIASNSPFPFLIFWNIFFMLFQKDRTNSGLFLCQCIVYNDRTILVYKHINAK